MLLQTLAPYQVARVVDFMKATLNKLPRSTRSAVEQYLRDREAKPVQFDAAVIRARKAMKHLYATAHIKPSNRADAILFKNDPPVGSGPYFVKMLAKATSDLEQAQLIVDHRIPYAIAVGAITKVTPVILVALINNMSASELINNLNALKKRGAMDHDEVKALIDKKLTQAQSAGRVNALKVTKAANVAKVDQATADQLSAIATAQIKAKGKITRPTALFVDKSSSMELAIEVGKQIASMLSTITEAELFVYAFDTLAYPIQSSGSDLAAWDRAFQSIRPGSWTSIGIGLETLKRKRQKVEQVLIVTDAQENERPYLKDSYKAYVEEMGNVHLVLVKVGSWQSSLLEHQLKDAGIEVESIAFDGDYYSLPNLIPMLSRPSRLDLLMEILETPLLERA
jgi:hypothetical protein